MKKKIHIFLIALLFVCIGKAQSVSNYQENPEWINYTKSNSGLPSNRILSITIDNNGNKWIGTNAGLVKFDNINWTVYNTDNSGLPCNYIYPIAIDEQNNKWIGAGLEGLTKFDGTNWIIYNTENSDLPDNDVRAIAIDNTGSKWIGTYNDNSLVKYNDSDWTIYNTENSEVKSERINTIAIDNYGNKLIGQRYQLIKYDNEEWMSIYLNEDTFVSYSVSDVAVDSYDNIWFVINSIGFPNKSKLAKYDNSEELTIYDSGNSGLPNEGLTSIAIDEHGNKWIGTWGKGLVKYDDTDWTVYDTTNSDLPDNLIRTIAIDEHNNKWIATVYDKGVVVFNENGVSLSTEQYVSKQKNIKIFPNPVQDYAFIQNESNSDIISIDLLNYKGKFIRSLDANNNKLNLIDIPAGFYILKIQTKSQNFNFKLTKI